MAGNLNVIRVNTDNSVDVFYPVNNETLTDIMRKIDGAFIYDGDLYEYSKWDDTTKTVVEDVDEKYLQELADWKLERDDKVANIIVTTSKGYQFDGNETAQTRMTRALLGLSGDAAIPWVLADDTTILATKKDLGEALYLAGSEQARLWTENRPVPPIKE